jgi:hypothetical protein
MYRRWTVRRAGRYEKGRYGLHQGQGRRVAGVNEKHEAAEEAGLSNLDYLLVVE